MTPPWGRLLEIPSSGRRASPSIIGFRRCPTTLKIYPNLTQILTKYLRQNLADFKLTTIRLSRNYAAKMHVDGNDHGLPT